MKRLITLAATALLSVPALAGDPPLYENKFGQYTVSCVNQTNSSEVSHCAFSAWVTAKNRTEREQLRGHQFSYLIAVHEVDLSSFMMIFGSPQWKISNRNYKVQMRFSDGGYTWSCKGIPSIASIKCVVNPGDKRQIWQDIANKNAFELVVGEHSLGLFSLKHSMDSLIDAVRALKRFKAVGGGTFDRSPDSGDTF